MRIKGVLERARGCHVEDTRAAVDGTREGRRVEEIDGEDFELGGGGRVEKEEVREGGVGEDGGVDGGVAWVL